MIQHQPGLSLQFIAKNQGSPRAFTGKFWGYSLGLRAAPLQDCATDLPPTRFWFGLAAVKMLYAGCAIPLVGLLTADKKGSKKMSG